MNHEIILLDESTIGKIAAGEVVERPLSVIKELIENAIDASAKQIVIEIRDGGKSYIRVTDDGIGIPETELDKVFLRHSTSKLRTIEDLYNLSTCGFRGEALSSISAVSKTTLITRTGFEESGNKRVVEGGKLILQEAIGCPVGTTLISEHLFFNVPAREKFMKSTQAESMAINQLICRYSMGRPEIKFKLISNYKVLLSTIGDGKLKNAIRTVYGKEHSEKMFFVENDSEKEVNDEELKVRGYCSKTSLYQANRRMQTLFFNGRYVEDFAISRAIEDAYKGLIPIGKFPAFVLFVETEPSRVDFNVHPNKLNIKYDPELKIEDKIYHLVRNSLLAKSTNMIPQISLNGEKKAPETKKVEVDFSFADKMVDYEPTNPVSKHLREIEESSLGKECSDSSPVGLSLKNDDVRFETEEVEIPSYPQKEERFEQVSFIETKKEEFAISEPESFYIGDPSSLEREETEENEKENSDVLNYEELKYIGQVFSTYMIMTLGEKMYLIDQHAAHERVLFERYLEMVEKENISSQQLLEHIHVRLDWEDSKLMESSLDLIEKLGFDIGSFGERTFVIRGVPVMFNRNQTEDFLQEVLELIRNNRNIEHHEGFIHSVATKACRAAIKANDRMTDPEALALMKQLNQCKNKYTCPHGRPIFIEVKKYDLEKMFKRINA